MEEMKKSNSPFFDQCAQPSLKNSYCVFLDVLGFTQMVQASFAGGDPAPLFDAFYRIAKAEIARLNGNHFEPDARLWDLKVFTDNIVLGYPLFSHDGEAEFGFVVERVAEYQLAMALEGFFIRGGFAIGPLFMDENIVYGPAVLEAYKAESEHARDPRIVLSRGVYSKVMSHMEYFANPEDSPQNRVLLVDRDGQAFINYLDQLILESADGLEVAWHELRTHKDRVEHNLAKFRDKPAIWSKYYWVANYHDYFCRGHEHLAGYSHEYLIDPKLAKPELSPLVKVE
jgi:hypothetical protein